MQNSTVNPTIFDWRLKSKRKSQKKRNRKDIWKRKFVFITENFTRKNSLNRNWNNTDKCRIDWWIQRYLFWRFKSKQKLEKNRSKIDIWKRKFLKNDKTIGNLRRKNSLNSNHREKYRIQRYLLEDLNWRKKTRLRVCQVTYILTLTHFRPAISDFLFFWNFERQYSLEKFFGSDKHDFVSEKKIENVYRRRLAFLHERETEKKSKKWSIIFNWIFFHSSFAN